MPRGMNCPYPTSGYLSHHWEMTDTYTFSYAFTWLPAQVMPVIKSNIHRAKKKKKKIPALKEHRAFKDHSLKIHDTEQKSADVEVRPTASGIALKM